MTYQVDVYINSPFRKTGFPYLHFIEHCNDTVITFYGQAAILMEAYKKGEETDDLVGILADYLEEHPYECDYPEVIPSIVECLRLMWTTQKNGHQLGY